MKRWLWIGLLAPTLAFAQGIQPSPDVTGTIWASVSTNTALKAMGGKPAGYTVLRQGYYAAGDGGQLLYTFSTSNCSISSGAGNDFTQVALAAGSGCWLAQAQPTGYDLRTAGMIAGDSGSNSAANAAIMTKIFAEPTGPKMIVPQGNIFRLACGTQYAATVAGLNFAGSGTLKFDASCTFSGTVFNWDGKSGGGFDGVTIDLNTPTVPGSVYAVAAGRAQAADNTSFVFQNSKIINGTSKALLVVGAATGGHTLSGWIARNNYIQMASATTQNQCVSLTTVAGVGTITSPLVEGNTCIGSGIQLDGTNPQAINNDVSAFEFGSGIYTAAPAALPYTATNCVITGNYIHDTGAGLDVNSTAHEGLEDHCSNTVAENNRFINLGGGGIITFSPQAAYTGNYINGIGKGYNAGNGTRTAMWVVKGASPDPAAGGNTTWIGNVVQDDGSTSGGNPAMLFGFRVESDVVGTIKGRDNVINISAATSGGHLIATRMLLVATGTIDYEPRLISYSWTQYTGASSVASMAWAPLDTTAFKNFYLTCHKYYPDTTADTPMVQVSEDGGGTYQTAATYVTTGRDWANGTVAAVLVTTGTGMQIGGTTWVTNQSIHGQFVLHCRDLDNTVDRKDCVYYDTSARRSTDNASLQSNGSGYWNGDANAIDGLKLTTVGGHNFFGICTLTGEL